MFTRVQVTRTGLSMRSLEFIPQVGTVNFGVRPYSELRGKPRILYPARFIPRAWFLSGAVKSTSMEAMITKALTK